MDTRKDFLNNFFNLKGRNVLVTGATGQLGLEICKTYLNIGARVIGTDINLSPKKTLKSQNIEYFKMDVSDKKSVDKGFERIYSAYKKLDILINNAGISCFEAFEDRPESSLDSVMDINLKGTFFCIQNYIKWARKKRHKKGNIINIASIYGMVSSDPRIYTDCNRKNSEIYGATKAGIIQMTKYFSVHAAQYGMRVNSVSPGGIFNPDEPQGRDFVKNYSHRCPMGRMAKCDEIIGGILYLSSDAASYVTGQNLAIDGGLTCW